MKKLLSVILAAVMIFGVMPTAFAASARGDVDGNGKITSADALVILRYSVGQVKTIDTSAADMNKDGKINSADALAVLQICVGAATGFDIPKTKDEMVALYKSALKATYYKPNLSFTYFYAEIGTITDTTLGKATPYNDSRSKTVTAQNGINKANGSKVELGQPGYDFDAAGVKSAKFVKNDNGTSVITLVLKEEVTKVEEQPVYNLKAAFGFFYTVEAFDGTSSYTGTTLELTIDNMGNAVALNLKMPYICLYKSYVGNETHSMKDVGETDYSAIYIF